MERLPCFFINLHNASEVIESNFTKNNSKLTSYILRQKGIRNYEILLMNLVAQ